MNILLLSTHLNPGGITSYLYTLSKGLIDRGHNVHVATSGGSMDKDFTSIEVKLLKLNIKTKSELSPKIYMAIKPLLKYIEDNRIDIIHSHTRITQVMGHKLGKKTKARYVSTCHGFFKTRLSRRMFPCWGERVIAISEPVKKHLVDDFNLNDQEVKLITNGVDTSVFTPASNEARLKQRERLNFKDEFIIGNIARLSDVKGPDILINALSDIIKEIPNLKLVFIGEGRMKDELHKRVDQLNIRQYVQFLTVSNQTSELLAIFDIFIAPSRQEGLGLSIMEAQAAGLPVIASKVGGIPSFISDGDNGILVQPQNSQELTQAVIQLAKNDNQRKLIAQRGMETIRNNHGADQMVDKTLKFYKTVSLN